MKLKINEYKIGAGIDRTWQFAFVSDLHDAPNSPIIEKLKEISPDAVLVGGDVIHNVSLHERGLEFVRLTSSLFPLYLSLGNHEARLGNEIKEKLIFSGAKLLDNSSVDLGGVLIGGLTSGAFYESGTPDISWLERFSESEKFKLLLCHHPEYYEKYIRDLPIDITLSGHAHGGQWRIFGRGIYAPEQGLFPKYTSGLYENRLIVGRGIGNKVIVPRINNSPEIILLTVY